MSNNPVVPTTKPVPPPFSVPTPDEDATGSVVMATIVAGVLCAVIYLGSMTYTLAHHRTWHDLVAFFVSVVFAAVALLSTVPLLIARKAGSLALPGRSILWGTCLALTGLQFTAAVMGPSVFTLSTLIGMTTILAVACFAELAGRALADL
ncbi:hypothetical protein [Streptomyces albipurpureus]|uniref:Integral membrane protein n=1 Tax=Streptomyces albipurpureus TaxID=2897419 RepID=A0ABT0V0Q8_9ACTN|nr:hypothetical protein [Streptomyces sp. CWNU-1]MCM2394422.1 hypothetical protein [Streptomyces sp. CWNU-1]